MASRDRRPDPQLENAADTYNSFGTNKKLRGHLRRVRGERSFDDALRCRAAAVPLSHFLGKGGRGGPADPRLPDGRFEAGGTKQAPEHPTGQPSHATYDAVVSLRVPCQDLLGAHVAVALRRGEDFDVARGFRHEVVDRVIGERGELLGSVGSRGHGAHGGEGVDGLRSSERDGMSPENSGAKQKRESFHSIWHAKSPET